MAEPNSPLRYPGGKGGLSRALSHLIELNRLIDPIYAEPFAGGAGAALSLLFSERVSQILLNDLDPCVYAFWRAATQHSDQLLDLLASTPISIPEWRRQRDIYRAAKARDVVKLGFATFYLNRCNRSGILMNGGPIGGIGQTGKWKLGARFNRGGLRVRIERIAHYRDRISVYNLDAIEFIRNHVMPVARRASTLVYLDPPYYGKGKELYLSTYDPADHERLAGYIRRIRAFNWLVSYDRVPQVGEWYQGCRVERFDLPYTAYERRRGQEILIFDPRLKVPSKINELINGAASRQAAEVA